MEATTEEHTTDEQTTEVITTEEITTEEITEEPTEERTTKLAYDAYESDLRTEMKYIFAGSEVFEETIMFLDYGDVKSLLFPADEIVSVTSYDCKTTYVEGVDYILINGKLKIVPGSSIPCITSEVYYGPHNEDTLWVYRGGQKTNVYWGDETAMTQWQVRVTYKHSKTWNGFEQECKIDVYEKFINKLIAGEDVTIFFYGDSITRGCSSSFYFNVEPYSLSYPLLFTYTLADLFDYTVTLGYANVPKTFGSDRKKAYEKFEDYVAGDRGTITFVNTAVGGWTAAQGNENLDNYVKRWIEAYGCDLFVYNFGMNNSGTAISDFDKEVRITLDRVIELAPDTSVMIVSTMTPNPNAPSWCGSQPKFEPTQIKTAAEYTENGVPCAVAQVTSASQAIITKKDFHDHTGNNINHPNDFLCRIYAQTMLQTLIGYENLK